MKTTSAAVVVTMVFAMMACGRRDGLQLTTYLDSIRAIDNHAHVVAPDQEHDTGYDALPCDAAPSSAVLPPANVRFGPDLQSAWKALYDFSGLADQGQLAIVQQRQAAARQQHGQRYFEWVLDQAGIDVALANRTVMVPPLAPPRFRWVAYDDALLFPLENSGVKSVTPDRKVFYEREERILSEYRRQAGSAGNPPSLDEYLSFVSATLTGQKAAGAIAIKFEAAYLRSLDFEPADRFAAAGIYDRYRAGGQPGTADYKTLQDFLFRHIAVEAGRLGLVVHIHTGNGCGDYFELSGGQPMLLGPALNDPALRPTSFVLLHGGSPFERTLMPFLLKPNVYVDTSVLALIWSPAELARILRPWLEAMPEHVIFGTDSGPWGPGMGWEETTWIAARRTRQALALVLTDMVNEHLITAARAREIASAVLRENAAGLYRLQLH